MGIIRGFVAGAGKGMADVSQMLLADKLSKERDEAEYLRRRELQGESQNYGTGEREASQAFQTGEKKLDREATKAMNEADNAAAVGVAKAKATESDKPTDSYRKYQELIGMGKDPLDAANVAYGADNILTNPKTGVTSVMGFGPDGKMQQIFIVGQEKTLDKGTPKTTVEARRIESKAPKSEGFNFVEDMAKKTGLVNGVMGEQNNQAVGNQLNSQTAVKQKTVTSSQYDTRMIDKYPELKNNPNKLKELRDAARKRGQISQ